MPAHFSCGSWTAGSVWCDGRNRRIAKDYENLGLTLAAFVTLACIQIAVRRLAR
jgi:hypothetical protein